MNNKFKQVNQQEKKLKQKKYIKRIHGQIFRKGLS